MAFNWQTFRTRTISGIIFVALMLTAILWNQWSLLVIFSIIHFGCWWEYLKIVEKIRNTTFHPYAKLGLMVMGYGLMLWFCGSLYTIRGYGIRENISLPVSAAGFVLLLIGIFQKTRIDPGSFGIAALGWVYISLCWGLLIDMYGRDIDIHLHDTMYVFGGQTIVLIIVISMWANDTMAYLVGSMIGKTPLTKISPKKTLEGTIGGIILGVALTTFLIIWIYAEAYFITAIVIAPVSFVVAVAGTFGDLLESKLKRMAGIKDSGNMMPGHGGFLDRFDSQLLAIPFAWLLLFLVIH
jgi:phosphatidate cytidylyltransferase